MSELRTNKISPSSDTEVTLGDSGDTFTIPSGVTITNSGTANGFGTPAAWAVKSSGTFSDVSGVEITGLSKTTRIVITSLNQTGLSGNAFYTSTNNGSSYDTGGSDYSFVQTQIHTDLSDGSSTVYNRIKNSMGQGAILSSFGTGGGANTASFDITIYDPANTSEYTAMSWEHIGRYGDGSNKGINSVKGATFRNSTGNVDAFKYSAGSGNFSGSYVALELN